MILSISFWAAFIGLFLSSSFEVHGNFLVPAYYAASGITPLFAIAFALSYSTKLKDKKSINIVRVITLTVASVIVSVFAFGLIGW